MDANKPTIKPIHVVSFSGGKDSLATLLLALDRVPRDRLRVLFIDTGNEHIATYEYLDALEIDLGIKIERRSADFSDEFAARRMRIARDQRVGRDAKGRRIRWSNASKRRALSVLHPTGIPFLDMCLLQGTFPSNRTRFCTKYLKRDVSAELMLDLLEKDSPVVVWQGTKRADSDKRANLGWSQRHSKKIRFFRPVLRWEDSDVFAFIRKRGVKLNPLYDSGFSRVSCDPCIYSRKSEIALLAQTQPEVVARIRAWESLVSRASRFGFAAFFAGKEIPHTPAQARERLGIDGVVRWAKVDFRKNKKASYEEVFETCAAEHGYCE